MGPGPAHFQSQIFMPGPWAAGACRALIVCNDCVDDAWINVSAEQLDKMLMEMSGRPSTQITDLQQLTDGMKTFINTVSGHEGAELPGSVVIDACPLLVLLFKVYGVE